MKTNILTIIIALLFVFQINAQSLNQEITKEGEQPFLLGKIDKNGLEGENYTTWFTKNYNDYKPNTAITIAIASELKTYSIKLFMGTWCEDSQRETPGIYKILNAANFNLKNLQLIAVDRDKVTPQKLEKNFNITNVPTLIFFKDGKEMNRIVEYPIESLEQDILNILTNQAYKNAYFEEE